jgi:hypothetical protein
LENAAPTGIRCILIIFNVANTSNQKVYHVELHFEPNFLSIWQKKIHTKSENVVSKKDFQLTCGQE